MSDDSDLWQQRTQPTEQTWEGSSLCQGDSGRLSSPPGKQQSVWCSSKASAVRAWAENVPAAVLRALGDQCSRGLAICGLGARDTFHWLLAPPPLPPTVGVRALRNGCSFSLNLGRLFSSLLPASCTSCPLCWSHRWDPSDPFLSL